MTLTLQEIEVYLVASNQYIKPDPDSCARGEVRSPQHIVSRLSFPLLLEALLPSATVSRGVQAHSGHIRGICESVTHSLPPPTAQEKGLNLNANLFKLGFPRELFEGRYLETCPGLPAAYVKANDLGSIC